MRRLWCDLHGYLLRETIVITFRWILIAAALMLSAVVGFSQTGNAIVKGAVTDASGATVPSAKVRLTNTETNVARTADASSEGLYYFGDVRPGSYSITIESAGFKRWTGTFLVQVGQTAIINAPLEVGDVSATIEVSGAAPVISTEGMQIAGVKDALRIHQLPLNGRQVANLFNLTPGVEGGGAARVNGMKVGSVEILQDGVSIVNRFGGGIVNVQPGLDTVQEFRIETNGSNARYSRPATVTLVTKSGTNLLHGSVFETHRNNAAGLRARRREEGTSPAKLIRNEFGASAGGPVVLPKLYNGRDKTFWFFSYEGLRQREKTLYSGDVVPTPAMWNGDFSNIVDNNGNRTHIYDPLTTDANGVRKQFPGDIIPQSRLSPIFNTFKAMTHAPTNGINPYQGSNLEVFYPLKTATNSYTTRIDHRFSERDNVFGRFTKSRFDRLQNGGRFGGPVEGLPNGYGSGLSETDVYSLSVSHTHVFTPNVYNELLLLGYRNPNHQGTLADGTSWASNLGLPNPFGTNGWPTVCAGNFCWDADNVKNQHMTAYNFEDNVTFIRGRHSLVFGGKFRKEFNNVRELQQSQGSHDFGGDWTALYDPANDQAASYTGDGFASMALGLPTYLSNQFNRGYFYFQQKEIGLYAHDSWRVNSRLTVELGVRWDKWTPYKEKYDRLVNVDIRNFANKMEVITPGNTKMEDIPGVPPSVLTSWAKRGLTWKTANEAGLPSSLLPADNNNFGPRLGAAFKLNNKTVARGGYGEYFWTMPLSQILQTSRSNPPLNLRYSNEIGNLDGTGTTALRLPPAADQYIGKAGVDINGVIRISSSAQSIMPWDFTNWRDGHAREWNFSFEREVMKNTALKLMY
ncbi:MAG TPA: TonB-dependent receptor, partial [Bryobacteraceae bacterium]|nr:TonB-dependent receptor [Bryobacteraceae bacterium]